MPLIGFLLAGSIGLSTQVLALDAAVYAVENIATSMAVQITQSY